MIQTRRNQMTAKDKKRRFLGNFSILLIPFLVANLNHNWTVSGETRNRSFQYEAWQTLTKESNFFKDVKSADIFISNNQNDAFETNAGSFYFNSGIRLAYMFRSDLIWPNFNDCQVNSNCKLSGVRQKSVGTIPNLTRGTYAPTRIGTRKIDDWVGINSRPGELKYNTIWAFDMFLLSQDTYVSYLGPFMNNEVNAMVDSKQLRVVTITNNALIEFRPSIANVCLVQDSFKRAKSGQTITKWKIPSIAESPSGESVENRSEIDFRELQIGTCQPS